MKSLKQMLVVGAVAIMPLMSQAQEGSAGTRGGGDPITARKIELSKKFNTLKADIIALVDQIFFIENTKVKAILISSRDRGLKDDIRQTNYQLAEKCTDAVDAQHAASTQIGVRNAAICFDLNKLVEQNTSPDQLMGLALHEHAHHFGYHDNETTYNIIIEVAKLAQKMTVEAELVASSIDRLNKFKTSHLTVWSAMYSLKQYRNVFSGAGAIALSDLRFMRLQQEGSEIIGFTRIFDQILTRTYGAKHKVEDHDYSYILANLVYEGAKQGKNLRWFVDQVDALYDFSTEK